MNTQDVDPRFDRAFHTACKTIGCDPLDLLGVMMSESGVRPAARNPNGNASGLIQFMPATLRGLGWKTGDQSFRCLSASQQLPFVIAYLGSWKKDAGAYDSAGRIYQAIFLPGTLKRASQPFDVLAAKGGVLGWAFEANAVFDANGDGRITLDELTQAVKRNARGPRWRELVERLGLTAKLPQLEDIDGDGRLDIVTVADVQVALSLLRVASLEADGINGPKTRDAVRLFQAAHDLHVDGVAGANTRASLEGMINTPTEGTEQ